MVIDHIGIVVRSIDQAVPLWRDAFGYEPITAPVVNTRQKVRVVFLEKAGSLTIKLIEPTETLSAAQGAAARGGGLHHLCFRCDSVEEGVAKLRSQGMRVLAEPQPGEAFLGAPIAFVYAGQGINVELIDTHERAARLVQEQGS